MVSIEMIRDLYRKMQRDGLATGNEAVYLRPELKTALFGDDTTLVVDLITLPIIVDTAIPEQRVGGTYSSDLYILDQEAFQRAAGEIVTSYGITPTYPSQTPAPGAG